MENEKSDTMSDSYEGGFRKRDKPLKEEKPKKKESPPKETDAQKHTRLTRQNEA